jgi:hypothetical protein
MRRSVVVSVLFAGFMAAAAAQADTLVGTTTLTPNTIEGLLGSGAVAYDALAVTDMSNGQLKSEVAYQVYTNTSGQYLYLYQVDNTGKTGVNSAAEMLTLGLVAGTIQTGGLGYLTETPDGFLGTPQQAPKPTAYIDNSLDSGLEISFSFLKTDGYGIFPGNHSVVLYILSTCLPGDIYGSVIDHNTGGGYLIGPATSTSVPEPGTCALLTAAVIGLAAFGFLRRK